MSGGKPFINHNGVLFHYRPYRFHSVNFLISPHFITHQNRAEKNILFYYTTSDINFITIILVKKLINFIFYHVADKNIEFIILTAVVSKSGSI